MPDHGSAITRFRAGSFEIFKSTSPFSGSSSDTRPLYRQVLLAPAPWSCLPVHQPQHRRCPGQITHDCVVQFACQFRQSARPPRVIPRAPDRRQAERRAVAACRCADRLSARSKPFDLWSRRDGAASISFDAPESCDGWPVVGGRRRHVCAGYSAGNSGTGRARTRSK